MPFNAKLPKGGLRAAVEANLLPDVEKPSEPRSASKSVQMPLLMCRCEHWNVVHAGAIGPCAFYGCECYEFKPAHEFKQADAPTFPVITFKDVKDIMGR